MKKILVLILALCLVFGFAADALAARPAFTQQPETATTSKNGKVSFSIKTSGTVKSITWHFIDPATGNDYTGKTLSKSVKGVRVSNPNGRKITLTRVPESMHGWTVYCHINGNGYKLDSERVMLLVYGMEPPADSSETASDAETTPEPEAAPPAEDPAGTEPAGGGQENAGTPEQETANPPATGEDTDVREDRTIVVSSSLSNLRALDLAGNVTEGDPAGRLEFKNTGSFLVSSEDPIETWTINGVRYELSEPVNEIKVMNVMDDMSVDLKVVRPSASNAAVDESHMCKVVCTGCTFTYLPAGLRAVTEGEVPAGAPIRVSADTAQLAANGYSVNGGEIQNAGVASFQLIVAEDTEIVAK